MKVAHYIGSHEKDTLTVRIGWWLTRFVQKGKYKQVTHSEAILAEHEDGSVTIGSSTLRKETPDGKAGVRTKTTRLTPGNWIIADVPHWKAEKSAEWFEDHKGDDYDWRGAATSWLPALWERFKEWFCSESIVASVGYKSPYLYGPSLLADICFSEGRDVTEEFFNSRKQ